jgi:hypothetical protein
MYKIPLTYEDPFTEEPRTEIAHFHLTMVECLELEESVPGGLAKKFGNLKEDNIKEIMEFFRILIRKSYGVKDGGRFIKRPELTDEFMSGPAFEVLFFRLLTDAKANTEFITKVMPRGLFTADGKVKDEAAILEVVRERGVNAPDLQISADDTTEKPKDPKDMSREELIAAFQAKSQS